MVHKPSDRVLASCGEMFRNASAVEDDDDIVSRACPIFVRAIWRGWPTLDLHVEGHDSVPEMEVGYSVSLDDRHPVTSGLDHGREVGVCLGLLVQVRQVLKECVTAPREPMAWTPAISTKRLSLMVRADR